MTRKIYHVQIELKRSKPGIWRRLLIPSDLLLSDFHKVIQATMGWTNSHLHQFIKNRTFYTNRMPDDDTWEDMNNVDYKNLKISDLLKEVNDDIVYEYDFGDSWEHSILLEEILPAKENEFYPVCIGGRMNCPPEDCGGIPGYLEMLKILKQPDHLEYQKYVKWLGGKFDPMQFNIDEVNELVTREDYGCYDKTSREPNQHPQDDFEAYSPFEIHSILYETFGEKSPLKLQELPDSEYRSIPILNQIKYIARILAEKKEIKLTNKGFLPVKIVADIYSQGFMKDEHVESGITKLSKETDSNTINLPRILLNISGLTKTRNNKLSLTKKGQEIMKDDFKLLSLIFRFFTERFNWAYYDGFSDNNIGRFGFGFTLILVSKYGDKKRHYDFYSQKYLKAFPALLRSLAPRYGTVERYASRCYTLRTFERFLEYFGLVTISSEKTWDSDKYIMKTHVFDKFIKVAPPGK